MVIMILDTVLISYDFMTDFNGPDRQYPQPQYPSGLYDNEKPQYKFGPDSSEYPNLKLPCPLSDEFGNQIPQGYYMVVLSDNMKYLDLYQSNKLIAKVKVIKLVEQMFTQDEINEENEIIGRLHSAQINKKLKKLKKAQEDLIAFKQKTSADSYAEILDSGKGYYILKYKYGGKKATGIIQK